MWSCTNITWYQTHSFCSTNIQVYLSNWYLKTYHKHKFMCSKTSVQRPSQENYWYVLEHYVVILIKKKSYKGSKVFLLQNHTNKLQVFMLQSFESVIHITILVWTFCYWRPPIHGTSQINTNNTNMTCANLWGGTFNVQHCCPKSFYDDTCLNKYAASPIFCLHTF